MGDILDRGDHELRTLLFLERLAGEARAAGGALHLLNGNHETMNAMGDLRYATPGGWVRNNLLTEAVLAYSEHRRVTVVAIAFATLAVKRGCLRGA